MISIDFIIKQLFIMMSVEVKVRLSKSQKTIACHNKYWKSIYDLLGEDIPSIIHKSSVCYNLLRICQLTGYQRSIVDYIVV